MACEKWHVKNEMWKWNMENGMWNEMWKMTSGMKCGK